MQLIRPIPYHAADRLNQIPIHSMSCEQCKSLDFFTRSDVDSAKTHAVGPHYLQALAPWHMKPAVIALSAFGIRFRRGCKSSPVVELPWHWLNIFRKQSEFRIPIRDAIPPDAPAEVWVSVLKSTVTQLRQFFFCEHACWFSMIFIYVHVPSRS